MARYIAKNIVAAEFASKVAGCLWLMQSGVAELVE